MLGWLPRSPSRGQRSPNRNRSLAKRVVTGQLLAGEAALDALLHAVTQVPGLDEFAEHVRDVAEVEEVALPFDELVAVEAKPAAADAVDLVLGAVGLVDDLFPEADDLALLLVDEHLLVLVDPVLQALHLQAERDV